MKDLESTQEESIVGCLKESQVCLSCKDTAMDANGVCFYSQLPLWSNVRHAWMDGPAV